MLNSFMWVILRRLNNMCRHFGTLSFSSSISSPTKIELIVFRNVGTQNSDAGKSNKRKNKTFKTRRKFETRKEEIYCDIAFCGLLQHLQRNPGQYHSSGYNSFHPVHCQQVRNFVLLYSILSCI